MDNESTTSICKTCFCSGTRQDGRYTKLCCEQEEDNYDDYEDPRWYWDAGMHTDTLFLDRYWNRWV